MNILYVLFVFRKLNSHKIYPGRAKNQELKRFGFPGP